MKRLPLTVALLAFFTFLLWSVSVRQSILYLIGIGMGATLAGARFGFTTGWRQLADSRDPKGSIGQIVLLLVALTLSIPLLANFPELSAALGPPSISLLIGAFIFGMSMQIADGCGSGSLYKAGMGIPLNVGILPLFAIGSFLGSVQLDQWLALGQLDPVNLVTVLGATQTVILSWVLLLATGFGIWWWRKGKFSLRASVADDVRRPASKSEEISGLVTSSATRSRTRPSSSHRATAPARHPRPWDMQPVRVAAHAFGPGQPHADLRLSPDHAVFAAGRLVPVLDEISSVALAYM